MVDIKWEFSSAEINCIQEVVATQADNHFVKKRKRHNVEPTEIEITESDFWDAHLTALLTSQQRSGPGAPVSRFVKEEMHTIGIDECRDADDVQNFISQTLKKYGGIRYYNNIGDACKKNLDRLDSGNWGELWDGLDELIQLRKQNPLHSDYAAERAVATYLSDEFAGQGLHRVGSKQSRNLLQILGLTRYEIPLDSRITKWLNMNLNLPYHITGGGLGNTEFYHFTMDLVQDACMTAEVVPCVFDAAVFSSYDTDWTRSDAESIF